jgi:glucose/arabinose dehydrogenase
MTIRKSILALALIQCLRLAAYAQVPPLDAVPVAGAPDVDQPLYVTAPPSDFQRLFIVQKTGQIRVRTAGGTFSTFLDLSALVGLGSEHGLLGLAFHPAYAANGWLYVYYTNPAFDSVVARYTVSAANPNVADPASALVVLTVTQPFSGHKAGCLQFGPDGYLYVALGDGGSSNDPLNNAQNLGSKLGKILRIDVDNPAGGLNYGIPPTNPYVGPGASLDEIWASGFRNPWRFSFDRLTGDLWIGDVGQDSREEIDFQPATDASGAHGGRNYGWRCREGSVCTGLANCRCVSPVFTNPLYDYSSALPAQETSVIGGYVYRGCAIPQLRGHYVFGDHGSGRIWTLTTSGTSVNVVDRTADLDPPGPAIIPSVDSFGEDAQGEVYVCCIEADSVWKIVPTTPQLAGVATIGTGTAGCNGAHGISLHCSPVLQNPAETVDGTMGPPGTAGVGVIGLVPLPAGSDPLGIGVETLVSLQPASFALYQFVVGPSGSSAFPVPIPNAPYFVGLTLYLQQFYVWSGCTPSPSGVSSSPALAITIQP